jgi:CheY-like chemotaxis protein
MKVMVVDDEQDVQSLFRQKFRKEIKQNQIKIDFAFSAQEALESLQNKQKNCFVLIIADINMPGMNGLELLRIVKERFPYLRVFIITAYDDDQKYQIAREYGADEYLTKPIEFDKLKEKILNL